MSRTSCFAIALLAATAPALAQVDWLPPEAEQGAARAMIARFAEAGVEIPGSDEERLQGAFREEKMMVVLGEYSVALVSAFLGDRFLARGGTDQDLERLLASDTMNQLSLAIQKDEAKRGQVMAGCGPMFEAMFADEAPAAPPG